MKRKNGTGSVFKLSGNRRNPYAARIHLGFEIDEVTHKEKPIHKFIGYFPTKDDALAALLEYNRNPYELNGTSFADIYKKWIATKIEKNLKPNSIRKYDLAFSYLRPLHGTPMKDFTLPLLQSYFDHLKASKDVLHLVESVLKQTIAYSIKRGFLPMTSANIMNMVDTEPRKETKGIERIAFNKEERAKLWKYKDNKWIAMILVYIYTGARFSELANLQPEHCFEDYIEIVEAKTVAGIRQVPLSDCVKELLPIEAIPTYANFRYNFTTALEQIGIYNHRIHDTRHTFITMMTEVETDPRILKQIVGHAEKNVTEKVYTHISLEKKIEAVNKINYY